MPAGSSREIELANLSITLDCNRSCSYCFARGVEVRERTMRRATFLDALDFLSRSGIPEVRLLGGEPTLHPDFLWFVERSIENGFKPVLFSNGLLSARTAADLQRFRSTDVQIVINVNDPDSQSIKETQAQRDTWSRLAAFCMLGFNIHKPNTSLDFLVDLTEKFELRRSIRLGLAHPRLDGSNDYLLPKNYPQVGERIHDFYGKARQRGIRVEFDCGFVPCMFPAALLKTLIADVGTFVSGCGPIPDILPDGTVTHCYPLASVSRCSLDKKNVSAGLKRKLEYPLQLYRKLGIYQECLQCPLKKGGVCGGGCLSAAMQRLRSASNGVSSPLSTKSPAQRKGSHPDFEKSIASRRKTVERPAQAVQSQFVIPYIDQPPEFWDQIKEEFGPHIKSVYFPLPGTMVGSGRPPQPHRYLHKFLSESLFRFSALINPVILERPIREIVRPLVDTVRGIDDRYGLTDVTVTNVALALAIKENIPSLRTVASTLMDISSTNQLLMVENAFDVIVPGSRIMRDLRSLQDLRKAFHGKIRLIVNEACLPGCPYRVQHFFEMARNTIAFPDSLCAHLLEQKPWMRLTGAWVLPQHLHCYDGLCDELKLAGRVTLNDPAKYRRVLAAYLNRQPLLPSEIGGGPASVLEPIEIDEVFYARTLRCDHQCDRCTLCSAYYEESCMRTGVRKRLAIGRDIDRIVQHRGR